MLSNKGCHSSSRWKRNAFAGFHQNIEKKRKKAWHDPHIRIKPFKVGGLVLLYDNNFFKHPGKLKIHYLGPYVIMHITDADVMKLQKLDGMYITGMVNGSRLKPYYDGCELPR